MKLCRGQSSLYYSLFFLSITYLKLPLLFLSILEPSGLRSLRRLTYIDTPILRLSDVDARLSEYAPSLWFLRLHSISFCLKKPSRCFVLDSQSCFAVASCGSSLVVLIA